MPMFVDESVLDNGLAHLQSNVDKVKLIKNFALGDTKTTIDGNVIRETDIAPGDMAITTFNTRDRKWNVNGKSGIVGAGTSEDTDDLHIAYYSTALSKYLYITDEITDQAIAANNPVDIPAGEYQSLQPVAV